MTGYGKASSALAQGMLHVEIKSLNGKMLDLSIRLPKLFQDKEYAIRQEVAGVIERGKSSVSVWIESTGGEQVRPLNLPALRQYFEQLQPLSQELGLSLSEMTPALLRLPDVSGGMEEIADEADQLLLSKTIAAAINAFVAYREKEGSALETEFQQLIAHIQSHLESVSELDPQRIEGIRERIQKNLHEFVSADAVDSNRFEQELIYYLEKIDITEEKQRLGQNLKFFLETLSEPLASGKKLGFIAQEIGREINTIGSKCNDANIQRHVVEMKNELEKIKEQVLNIL